MSGRGLKILSIGMLFVLLMAIGGCSKSVEQIQENPEGKLVVYASIYPMYDFAKSIGKDKINLKMMLPPGVEAHDWEPPAKLMGEMEKTHVFIYNGLEMEPWVEKLLGSVQNKELVVVQASEGVELQKFQGHEAHGEGEEAHGEYDPHVWLNPMNAVKQGENIKDALVKADEKNKDYYEANFKVFAEQLIALDEAFKQELSHIKRKEILVSHAAFGYLTHRYGLEQLAITGLSPQEEPSAAKLVEMTRFAKDHDIQYIFFETLTSPKLAEVLAKEVGAQTAVLNPVEGLTQQEMDAGKNYISIMEENLAVLKKALGE